MMGLHMKTLITLLLLLPAIGFSQSSILYNADGTLKADKQYKIDKETLANVPIIEKELLASVYNNIRYPAMAKENNFGGSVIVKLVTKDSNTNFEVVKSSDIVFKEALERFFKNMPESYLYSKVGYHGPGVFYLPIKFQMLKSRFKKTLTANKMLTIEALDVAPESHVVY
jgi:hypothetical protein